MEEKKNISLYLKNKFFITIVVFLVWLIFFDQNNLVDRVRSIRKLNKMYNDIEYYRERIYNDSIKTYELLSDKDNLEKFAREEYLMKKDNEEVFIVVEE